MTKRRHWNAVAISMEVASMGLEPDKDDFKVAVILLSMWRVGTKVPKLQAFTGYQTGFIRKVVSRCKAAGLITADGLEVKWRDRARGEEYFMRDVQMAVGLTQ